MIKSNFSLKEETLFSEQKKKIIKANLIKIQNTIKVKGRNRNNRMVLSTNCCGIDKYKDNLSKIAQYKHSPNFKSLSKKNKTSDSEVQNLLNSISTENKFKSISITSNEVLFQPAKISTDKSVNYKTIDPKKTNQRVKSEYFSNILNDFKKSAKKVSIRGMNNLVKHDSNENKTEQKSLNRPDFDVKSTRKRLTTKHRMTNMLLFKNMDLKKPNADTQNHMRNISMKIPSTNNKQILQTNQNNLKLKFYYSPKSNEVNFKELITEEIQKDKEKMSRSLGKMKLIDKDGSHLRFKEMEKKLPPICR